MSKAERSPVRVLAFAAHPDDVELFCAGTLARCVERGDDVAIAIACKGDSASLSLPAEELTSVRAAEADAAAAVIGARVLRIGLPDWGVDVNVSTRTQFADAIRQAVPDVILTHSNADYGSDHNNTSLVVRDAALVATLPSVKTAHPVLARTPAIFLWEPLGGYGFQPEVYVDITPTLETKLRMLECHRSQREWMQGHGGMDFADYVRTTARFRGYQAGVQYAEGFVPLKNWANMRAHALLP